MNRRSLILALTVFLVSCGFQPLHGQEYRSSLNVDLTAFIIDVKPATMANTSALGNVSAPSTIPRRYGELLKAEIGDRMNPMHESGEKLFTLDITYTETDISLFVRPDGTASRGNLLYTSPYTIKRLADGKVVASGTLTSTSSYNTSPSADYASYVSIEDARKRGVLDLAETYKLRLAALLPTFNAGGSAIEQKQENVPALQPVRGYENSTPGY